MNQHRRSRRRTLFGLFAIALGLISLVGFPSTSVYNGLGLLGGAYGAVMIVLGVALIAKKEAIME